MNCVPKQYNPSNWERPSFEDNSKPEVIEQFRRYCWIGADTINMNPEVLPFIINLAGFIYDRRCILKPTQQIRNGISSVEYLGIRWLEKIGNPSEGTWDGYYKCVQIQDPRRAGNPIVGIAVRGTQKTRNDRKLGTRTGTTALVVAIKDDEKGHNSLQLRLDNFAHPLGTNYIIRHDGALTVGRHGRAKNSDVLDYVSKQAPELARFNQSKELPEVELGTLDNSRQINWEQQETRNFTANLIRYALIRDQFRFEREQEKHNRVFIYKTARYEFGSSHTMQT